MISDPITLVGDSASTRDYAIKDSGSGSTIRGSRTAPIGYPELLSIKHTVSSKGGLQVDRHLVRLDLAKASASGPSVNASVYVVIELPRDSALTVAMVRDMRTQMINFISVNATLDKILNGEP